MLPAEGKDACTGGGSVVNNGCTWGYTVCESVLDCRDYMPLLHPQQQAPAGTAHRCRALLGAPLPLPQATFATRRQSTPQTSRLERFLELMTSEEAQRAHQHKHGSC